MGNCSINPSSARTSMSFAICTISNISVQYIQKIDISKAYDKVDWGFLKGMLNRMGFSDKWVQWMMMCQHGQLLGVNEF
jgi:hypothetical protein